MEKRSWTKETLDEAISSEIARHSDLVNAARDGRKVALQENP